MPDKIKHKKLRIGFLRRLVITFKIIHKAARVLRFPILLTLLLINSDLQKAVQRTQDFSEYDFTTYLLSERNNQFSTDYLNHIQEHIDLILARHRFNGSVLIAEKGQVVYENHSGISDLRDKSSYIDESTVFQLASVGKQFTAVAVMKLYDQGLFDFDDPVDQYIDRFPYAEITIRQLLNHTSGLQNYMYILDNYWHEDRYPSNSDLVDLFIKHDLPLNFTPGRRFSYSNTGYAFLALLVEEVSGMPFPDYMKTQVFAPLGMNNSFVFDVNSEAEIAGRAYGFNRRHTRWAIPLDYHDGIMGDKGYFGTARDLFRWNQALTHLPPVSPQCMEEATSRAELANGRSVSYGFGWRLKQVKGHEFIYHHGWWRGFRTAFKRLPEKDLLIVVLNNTNSNIGSITRHINSVLLEDCTHKYDNHLAESL